METEAAPALAMIIGTRNGETLRSPFSTLTSTWDSRVYRPPMPVAIMTPRRMGSAVGSPPSASAMPAAARANCSTRSARRTSLGPSNQGSGSKSGTSRWSPWGTGCCRPVQNASLPMPQGVTTPMPVTTTRRPSFPSIRAWR